ncbi:hypothetical protein [Mesonia sp. K4-1]|uniref:hypothetical protein n=1 Tax=Mesonia sp. K4-1 TaxID=2602760 RepID=UPI0011CBBF2D|nr:hypothetical protein [Mesonia sp. K4-1]TXK75985.1 hypothetical protein FT986_08130 [Mesonia sp. K4-1]
MKNLKFIVNVFLITIIIFLFQNFLWYISNYLYGNTGSLNNIVYSFIYLFIYFFTFYLIIVGFYNFICFRTNLSNVSRFLLAQTFSLLGYIIFRGGDIIDGQFTDNFSFNEMAVFLITGVMLFFLSEKFTVKNKS